MYSILMAMILATHEPIIIAHQGGANQAPENTIAAFQKCLDQGLTFFECDVRLSKEGIPVIIHNPTTELYIKEEKEVQFLTLEEIRKLDAGSHFSQEYKGEKIPTLKEILDLLVDKGTIMLELKYNEPRPKLLVKRVMEPLETYPKKKVILGSFSPAIVAEVRKQNPDIPLIGIADQTKYLQKLLDLGLDHIALDVDFATEDLVEALMNQNVKVWIWTVNSLIDFHKFHSLKVGGIITDEPYRFHLELQMRKSL